MTNSFKQANAFAMQYGLVLGVWGFLTLAAFAGCIVYSWMSFLSMTMASASLILSYLLTARFRDTVKKPGEAFPMPLGFLFTFGVSIYASLWIAVGVFMYLSYFDNGWIFDQYAAMVTSPEYVAELKRAGMYDQINSMTGGQGMTAMVDALRALPPVQYAGMVIYSTLLTSPVISLIIALICRRSAVCTGGGAKIVNK